MRTITNKPIFEIADLAFQRPQNPIFEGLSLTVNAGEHIALLGGNGSGKSTLLELIIGTIKPERGKITRHTRAISFVPQRSAVNELLPMTVLDTVKMGRWRNLGQWRRFSPADMKIVHEQLERLRIADLAGRGIQELSGGQRQRTLIASALASQSELLLLDEPEAGLDAEAAESISEVLTEERERGTTIIIATHDLQSANRARRCVVLNSREKGIVADGDPQEIINDRLVARTFA